MKRRIILETITTGPLFGCDEGEREVIAERKEEMEFSFTEEEILSYIEAATKSRGLIIRKKKIEKKRKKPARIKSLERIAAKEQGILFQEEPEQDLQESAPKPDEYEVIVEIGTDHSKEITIVYETRGIKKERRSYLDEEGRYQFRANGVYSERKDYLYFIRELSRRIEKAAEERTANH